MRNCDAVDLTFACIGGVDAMLNSINWLHTEPDQVAIVVACDNALYDLDSSGEYTQGAGAAALLLTANPQLITINPNIGVACADEHDFFKPLHTHTVTSSIENQLSTEGKTFKEHRETPVFDGYFSNQTYAKRINEAWKHYNSKLDNDQKLSEFSKYIFHLPYAYHGRRIFADMYFDDMDKAGELNKFLADNDIQKPNATATKEEKKNYAKARVKSNVYQNLIKQKIAPSEKLSSQIGNVYTASIFLALISTLIHSDAESLTNQDLLFIAYGSGSKSKIFSGTMEKNWEKVAKKWNYNETLDHRKKITFEEYEAIRKQEIDLPICKPKSLRQESTGILDTNRYAKYYGVE